jgi:hypothetical protein
MAQTVHALSHTKLTSSGRRVLIHRGWPQRAKKVLHPAAWAEEHAPGNRKAADSFQFISLRYVRQGGPSIAPGGALPEWWLITERAMLPEPSALATESLTRPLAPLDGT